MTSSQDYTIKAAVHFPDTRAAKAALSKRAESAWREYARSRNFIVLLAVYTLETMGIIQFLVDTSASMNQRCYLGTSYLDVAKGAIDTFMKVTLRA